MNLACSDCFPLNFYGPKRGLQFSVLKILPCSIKQKPQLTKSTVERIVKKQVKEEYNEQHQQNLLEAQKIQAEAMSKQYEAMAAQNEQHQQKLLEAQKIQAKAMSDLVDKIFENQNTNAPNVPNGSGVIDSGPSGLSGPTNDKNMSFFMIFDPKLTIFEKKQA